MWLPGADEGVYEGVGPVNNDKYQNAVHFELWNPYIDVCTFSSKAQSLGPVIIFFFF